MANPLDTLATRIKNLEGLVGGVLSIQKTNQKATLALSDFLLKDMVETTDNFKKLFEREAIEYYERELREEDIKKIGERVWVDKRAARLALIEKERRAAILAEAKKMTISFR